MAYEELTRALSLLGRIERADDLKFLWQGALKLRDLPYRMHGHPDGWEGYRATKLSPPGRAAWETVEELSQDDLRVMEVVCQMLYQAHRVRLGGLGTVVLKTIGKDYPQIDFKTGLYELDEQGNVVTLHFDYTYCYVSKFGTKGDADRKRRKNVAIYFDKGMGRGGSGGWVAAALDRGLIESGEILDAFAADDHENFFEACEQLVRGAEREKQR